MSARAIVRLYAELNDLARGRKGSVVHEFVGCVAVRDLIERMGIPHTEVDLVLVNGESVGLDHVVCDGDRVSVFPVFESIDVSSIQRVRERPLRRTGFVLDVHLGALARILRMFGFDALYRTDADDDELAEMASEGRILLTRDRGLLKRRAITHGYLVRHTRPRDQAAEVLRRFDLLGQARPFTRCIACNGVLEALSPDLLPPEVPPRVRATHEEFSRCPSCGRVFWRGSHYRAMMATLEAIARKVREGRHLGP